MRASDSERSNGPAFDDMAVNTRVITILDRQFIFGRARPMLFTVGFEATRTGAKFPIVSVSDAAQVQKLA